MRASRSESEVVRTSSDEATLRDLRRRVGYQQIEVDPENGFVRKKQPDIHCDLSGIAKGYGVDRVAEALDEIGIDNYMIEVGGEVRTRGLNADGVPWRIAIERPDSQMREIETVVPLSGYALATSGDYRIFVERGGERFSHIIDPRSGRPKVHKLASVSVIHPKCAMADAYATALLVVGPEAAQELAEQLELASIFITHAAGSGFKITTTSHYEAFRKKDKS